MAFFIEGQVIVQLTDFIRGWLFKPGCCPQCESTAISRLCSQLESELFVWNYVVGANLAVVLLTALANICWSLGLMFRDWLMLFSARHIVFTYIMLFTSQTMLGKAKRLIESFWVKSSNWSKLRKHRMTVRSEAALGKSVRSGNLRANVICPNAVVLNLFEIAYHLMLF